MYMLQLFYICISVGIHMYSVNFLSMNDNEKLAMGCVYLITCFGLCLENCNFYILILVHEMTFDFIVQDKFAITELSIHAILFDMKNNVQSFIFPIELERQNLIL